MKESEVQGKFGKWVVSDEGQAFVDALGGACAFELKMMTKLSGGGYKQYEKKIEMHQRDALLRWGGGHGLAMCSECGWICGVAGVDNYARPTGISYHKISDMSAGAKPFDCFAVSRGRGMLVLVAGVMAMIVHIEDWEKAMCRGVGRVGLRYEELSDMGIAVGVVSLKTLKLEGSEA